MVSDERIKTGTTTLGMLFKGGVLLAADRRVTSYKIVSDKFTKIFDLSPNAVATVSGGAADAQLFMRIIQGELKLISLKNEREAKVKEAAMILNSMQYRGIRSMGSIVGLIIGGYDKGEGASLYDLSPDGTISLSDGFLTTGSGSIYVQGLLDDCYKPDLSEKEALDLAERAFKVAFKNDNASGGGFIAKVVTKDGIKEAERKIIKADLVKE